MNISKILTRQSILQSAAHRTGSTVLCSMFPRLIQSCLGPLRSKQLAKRPLNKPDMPAQLWHGLWQSKGRQCAWHTPCQRANVLGTRRANPKVAAQSDCTSWEAARSDQNWGLIQQFQQIADYSKPNTNLIILTGNFKNTNNLPIVHPIAN